MKTPDFLKTEEMEADARRLEYIGNYVFDKPKSVRYNIVMNTHNAPYIPGSLIEAIAFYSNEQNCFDTMVALRWPNGVCCPRCGDINTTLFKTRPLFKCNGCKKQFTVKVGTIFEDSPLSLSKWLPAVWLLGGAKNGISSCELARALDVQQRTAWFMLHRIRHAMQTGSFEKMSGTIEVDETFVGGKAKNMHKKKREERIKNTANSGKTIVMGILERSDEETGKTSRVHARIIPNRTSETLHPPINSTVNTGSEVFTDGCKSYSGLSETYSHEFVDHAVKYVEGKVHTNSLENFWSLLDRSLTGTYVSVEPYHLLAYVDEQAFRFNERKDTDAGRFVKVLQMVSGKRLTYETLTNQYNEYHQQQGS